MALEANDLARLDGNRLDYRADPLRVRVEIADLVTADHHDLRCVFECSVRPGDHPADRKMLAEVLMADRPAITRGDVAAHLLPRVHAAAAEAAAAHPVSAMLADAAKSTLLQSLRKAADQAAFAAGLTLLPPFQLDITSPSFQKQQWESAQRARAEEQAAGRIEHLRHAGDLLKQIDAIRADNPHLAAGQLLERVAPADRGATLESLIAASAGRAAAQTLYAVAGPYLVTIDPRQRPLKPALIALPASLGPLRSVQAAEISGDKVLLVGARSGFYVWNPGELSAAPMAYADPDIASALGFNRVIYLGERGGFWATHSDGGVVHWTAGNPSAPESRLRPADLDPSFTSGPRHLQPLSATEGICAIKNRLVLLSEQRKVFAAESSADIVAIISDGGRVYIVHEDGLIVTMDRDRREMIRRDPHGGRICAAGALPWLDGLRLLVATDGGPIECIGTDDSLVTRYNSAYRGLRDIAAAADSIVAVSPDRQRLVLWDSWDGRAPALDLHLTSLARHRIADITFA